MCLSPNGSITRFFFGTSSYAAGLWSDCKAWLGSLATSIHAVANYNRWSAQSFGSWRENTCWHNESTKGLVYSVFSSLLDSSRDFNGETRWYCSFLGFQWFRKEHFFFSASKKIQRWNFTSSWTRSFAFVFLFLPPPSNVSKAFEILNVMNSMSKKQLHNQRQARDEQCVELIARPFLQWSIGISFSQSKSN